MDSSHPTASLVLCCTSSVFLDWTVLMLNAMNFSLGDVGIIHCVSLDFRLGDTTSGILFSKFWLLISFGIQLFLLSLVS